MKFSKVLENLNDNFTWVDQTAAEAEVYSIKMLVTNKKIEPGIIYIGSFSDVPNEIIANSSFICNGNSKNSLIPSGKRNIVWTNTSTTEILNSIYPYFEQAIFYANAVEQLTKVSTNGAGLMELLEMFQTLTAIPLLITANDHRVIAFNEAAKAVHPDFARSIEKRRLVEDRIHNTEHPVIQAALHTYDDLYFMWSETDQQYLLIASLHLNKVKFGYFVAVVNTDDPLRHYSLLRFIVQLVTLEMQKDSFYRFDDSILENVLFRELVEETITPVRIDVALKKLRWQLSDELQLIIITGKNDLTQSNEMRAINQKLRKTGINFYSTFFQGKWILLLPQKSEPLFWNVLENRLKNNQLFAGVSHFYRELKDTGIAYKQAKKSLEYAIIRDSDDPIEYYANCLYFVMYEELARNCDPFQFCHQGVIEIWKKDASEKSNWLKTLELYLEYVNQPEKAALELHIHKNTLFYRIKKCRLPTILILITVRFGCRLC